MKHVDKQTDEMSKASVSFLATLSTLDGLAEEEKSGNAKDVKTRQTCRYQDGDVPRTTTSNDREEGDGETIRENRRERERRDNRVEQVGKTLKRAANAFIATLDSTLA